jgi:tRNA wybutosine-synthesizing protein 4
MDIYSSVTQKQVDKKHKAGKLNKGKNDHKTKKIVHDLFVQGTNDSSIVSKRSVEILYTNKVEPDLKHFFQYFVKKSPRRTPVINRGYWIRMKSIRMAIEKIIEQQQPNQRINIINLGCGYDPLPFQLLDDKKFKNIKLFCIDVDYPELVGYKSQMIHMAPELVELIGTKLPENPNIPGIQIHTEKYATMGCDLTNRDLYCKQLDYFMANDSLTTNIFIAEVSLAYMTPETANPIIKTSSEFSNSHFLILEQLMPSGENHPFAKRMVNHFKKMGAPLQCVHKYPTIEHQIERFKNFGYTFVNARDLLGCWQLVDNEIKKKVEEVEAFDEWEEFVFFGQHYINLHATNQENVVVYPGEYKELYSDFGESSNHDYNFEVQKLVNPELQRKFHTSLNFNDKLFLTSGTNQSRLADTVSLNISANIKAPETFKPRISATSVTIGNAAFLIGGRRIPGYGIDEVWKLQEISDNFYGWEQKAPLPTGRVKHTSIAFGNGILVYGGSKGEGFTYYSVDEDRWTDLKFSGPGFESSNLVMTSNGLYLIGGKLNNDGFELNPTLYKVNIDLDAETVEIFEFMNHPCLARYGFKVISNTDKVLIIGGVGKKLYNQFDTIIEIDTTVKIIKGVKIDDSTWSKSPVFIGSDISFDHEKPQFWITCGGAVCYGFGSVWNDIVSLGINIKPTNKLLI